MSALTLKIPILCSIFFDSSSFLHTFLVLFIALKYCYFIYKLWLFLLLGFGGNMETNFEFSIASNQKISACLHFSFNGAEVIITTFNFHFNIHLEASIIFFFFTLWLWLWFMTCTYLYTYYQRIPPLDFKK